MRSFSMIKTASALSVAALLAACQTNPAVNTAPAPAVSTTPVQSTPTQAVTFGTVTNIQIVAANQPAQQQNTGIIGSVLGGVAGGVLGNQVGKGTGKKVATVVGTIGGALIGNAIEKGHFPGTTPQQQPAAATTSIYRVTVQQDNGVNRTFDYAVQPNVTVGTRVRIENNQLYR